MISTLLLAASLTYPGGTFYDFKLNSLEGKPMPLRQYKGKVLLVVNVASYCGNTPQYKGLEGLYEKYKAKGFVVLGFPANEFGAQEPGTSKEIREFCEKTYHVKFPMFEKIVVKGEGIHPLYKWLVDNGPRHDDIEWNFAKFLIGRDGKILERFSPRTKPESAELVKSIEKALGN